MNRTAKHQVWHMQPTTRLILLCMAAIFFLPVSFVAGADRFAAGGGNGVVVEREKRFLQRALDDLVVSRKLAEEDISGLERQKAALTPLEPSRREDDLSDLLDWYYRYYDWLMGEEGEAESELVHLSAPGAIAEMRVGRFGEMADKGTELARELNEKVKGYGAERKRLAAILDRRRLLQAQFSELEAQLARLG